MNDPDIIGRQGGLEVGLLPQIGSSVPAPNLSSFSQPDHEQVRRDFLEDNGVSGEIDIPEESEHSTDKFEQEEPMVERSANSASVLVPEEVNVVINNYQNLSGATVGDLMKIYKKQMPQAAANTGNPRKNPLIKCKG